MKITGRIPGWSVGRRGFTLIELLIVVGILAFLSAVLVPAVLSRAAKAKLEAQKAAQAAAISERGLSKSLQQVKTGDARLPIIHNINLKIGLHTGYSRIGTDVFTHYTASYAGNIKFSDSQATAGRVMLAFPLPRDANEAREVSLAIGTEQSSETSGQSRYDLDELAWAGALANGREVLADISFKVTGRDRFEWHLPKNEQLRNVNIQMDLAGAEGWSIPDYAFQPTKRSGDMLVWEVGSVITYRPIVIDIPARMSPMGRVLLLSKLVAIAVLLFGFGFWYLSELYRPGLLDAFRWGHFLLLALTYSLFFVLFAVLSFHGNVETVTAMIIAAAVSLPLFVLHVARVLDFRFALTRALPIAVFTLLLVITGVYGGAARDYIYIGALALALGFITLTYPEWSRNREHFTTTKRGEIEERRRALRERYATEVLPLLARLHRYGSDNKSVDFYLASLDTLNQDTLRLLVPLPLYASLHEARDRTLALEGEFDVAIEKGKLLVRQFDEDVVSTIPFQGTPQSEQKEGDRPGGEFCMTCGATSATSPYCSQCGTRRPLEIVCSQCGTSTKVPAHLIREDVVDSKFHCPGCGISLTLDIEK